MPENTMPENSFPSDAARYSDRRDLTPSSLPPPNPSVPFDAGRFDAGQIVDAEDEPASILPFWQRTGKQNYALHILLFFITLITTTLAGLTWGGYNYDIAQPQQLWQTFANGLPYSISVLLILTCHEFGHFFATMHHSIRATLPYFIPLPQIPFLINIGTFGAVIKIKERIADSRALFDIGVYGPISGFVVALAVLVYGFATVPPVDYLYRIHPEYEGLRTIPLTPDAFSTGKNLLYLLLERIFYSPSLPPMHEMYHYPFLFAGWIGCMVTAINLLPVGQLDGGHIVYAMFGRRVQRRVARIVIALMLIMGLPVFLEQMGGLFAYLLSLVSGREMQFAGMSWMPEWLRKISWPGWALWAFILLRFVRIDHPPVEDESPLDTNRVIIGWISIAIFILCFTPVPFGIG